MKGTGNSAARLAASAELVQAEARAIDDQRWDDWLSFFTDDCEFWVPAWRADGTLVTDPTREVSHIFNRGIGALEDRVFRIRSGFTAAATPMQRTTHILGLTSSVTMEDDADVVRTAFSCHVYFPRERISHTFFGDYVHRLGWTDEALKILLKTVVLKNDHIPTMIDFYCL